MYIPDVRVEDSMDRDIGDFELFVGEMIYRVITWPFHKIAQAVRYIRSTDVPTESAIVILSIVALPIIFTVFVKLLA